MPRLLPETREARRQQILGAAQRCFTSSGFQSTSMQDIFSASGLSAGAVYSHFSGKDEIITAIAEDVIRKMASTVDAALPTGVPPPALDEVMSGVFGTLLEADIAPIAVVVWGEAIRDPALRERLSALYSGLTEHFADLVAACQQRGTVDAYASVEHTAVVLTSFCAAFIHQLALGPGIDASAFSKGLRALMRV